MTNNTFEEYLSGFKRKTMIGGLDLFPTKSKFVPEIEPTIINYKDAPELFKERFPKTPSVHRLLLSNIGKYSVNLPTVAEEISQKILGYFPKNRSLCITDATANMGGNVINFARHFKQVQAVEIIPLHCKILRNNIQQYPYTQGVVSVHCGDYLDLVENLKQDVVFFDPPWGGLDYKNQPTVELHLDTLPMHKIITVVMKYTTLVALYAPKNYNCNELRKNLNYQKYRMDVHQGYRYPGNKGLYYLIIVSHVDKPLKVQTQPPLN